MTIQRKFTTAIAAFGIVASLASGAFANERPEGPSFQAGPRDAAMIKQVPASDVYRGKELARLGLSADELIEVTVIPSSGRIDGTSADDNRS